MPNPPAKALDPAVEIEAKRTSAMFENVSTGENSLSQVFAEIERDRKKFGFGSEQEKEYVKAVHATLKDSKLLPQLSLNYAKENFQDLACNKSKISSDTMYNFRVSSYKDMTNVERIMIHYLRDNFDYLKGHPDSSCKTQLSERDVDKALEKAKTGELKDKKSIFLDSVADKNQAATYLSALTVNDNLLLEKLQDRSVLGITKDSLKHSLEFDEHYLKHLNGPERQTTYNMLENFDKISRGDDVISNLDLRYFGAVNGIDTPTISHKAPKQTSNQKIRSFDR